MGTVIQAICECGYESEPIYVGYSMETMVPNTVGFCEHCEKVMTIFDDHPICPDCGGEVIVYEAPTEETPDDDIPVNDSAAWLLEKPEWYCPVCKNHSLQFVYGGLWD